MVYENDETVLPIVKAADKLSAHIKCLEELKAGTREFEAAAKQTLTPSNLDKIDDFVKIFQTYVETDLTLGNLAWLGKEAISMGPDAISFSTLPCEWKSPYIYLNQEETLTLINQHLNPYVEDRVPEDLKIPS